CASTPRPIRRPRASLRSNRCHNPDAGLQETPMDDPNRKSLIDRYIAAYNAFDVEGMLALLAPGIVFENFSNGQRTSTVSGVDEFRRLAEASTSLFSEREQRITAWRQGPDHAVASIAYRGRLAVDMPDGPP